ncbi:MAG TPA: hypothetical protein VF556_15560 [Pyrinomonadaceae bacterium]
MKKLTFILAAIAICFGITSNISAQYVTAEFLNSSADGTLNKVRMDKPGVPYSHNVDGVTAQFYPGGSRDLVIALNSSKAKRTTIYDFTAVSDYTNVPGWIYSTPVQTFKPFINVLEAYRAKENCAAINGVYNCDFKTRMNNGYLSASGDNASYALLWNPEARTDRKVNSPEQTSFVNVNYYKGTDGKEVFTITPLPNCATRENNFTCGETDVKRVIAGLEKTSGKTVSSAGQYIMPFTLVVRPK